MANLKTSYRDSHTNQYRSNQYSKNSSIRSKKSIANELRKLLTDNCFEVYESKVVSRHLNDDIREKIVTICCPHHFWIGKDMTTRNPDVEKEYNFLIRTQLENTVYIRVERDQSISYFVK